TRVCIVLDAEGYELNARERRDAAQHKLVAGLARYRNGPAPGAIGDARVGVLDGGEVGEVDRVLVPSTEQWHAVLVVVQRVPAEPHEGDHLGLLSRRHR